ncbi:MAG: hypothetical protein GXY95_07210 [Clostridiales bacterium]|mgnify:CR=1 FL=1|jgi:hypothetical protein|nr:hypothetical protein [Clostridiales bacterium]HOA33105.1 hypothetical protein [Clostridiales bacterium]HOJ36473.1 hypothetical protein [Clostridiales bacterium]HOL79578.1 hypothetical protein [Clostridiales bacterium]HPP68734.1 hypothetical protein [Clostridiales bacterium]
MPKYSFENTIGELLDTPETRALIDELCPELLEHPMLEVGRPFKVNQALPFIEGLADKERIENFRRRLEAIE